MPIDREFVICCVLKLVTPWVDRGIESIVKEKEMERRKVKEKKFFGNTNNTVKKSNPSNNKLRFNQISDSTPTT